MIRHPLRILITAFSFYTVLPLFAAIHFLGSFVEALGLAAAVTLCCSLLYLVTDFIESTISFRLARRNAGLAKGLVILLTYWLTMYVVAPGLLLKLTAALVPSLLSVHGVRSVLVGGLILFFIGYFTGAYSRQPEECEACSGKCQSLTGPAAAPDEKAKPQSK